MAGPPGPVVRDAPLKPIGSSNEVVLSLSNANYVYYYGNIYVGPKGDRTVAASMSRSGD
jgi:hypothetical protein